MVTGVTATGARKRIAARAPVKRQAGGATLEYTLISILVVIVLIASPSAIDQILDALKGLYQAFAFAIGITYPTPGGGA